MFELYCQIRYSRLTDYFPQYTGDIHNDLEARDFILQVKY